MAIVSCSKANCIENIAGECVRQQIFLFEDECQCYIKGPSTGEVIEQNRINENAFTEMVKNRFNQIK